MINFLFGGLVAWGLVYEFLYSPKARIKRLWKEVFLISSKIYEQKKLSEGTYDPLVRAYEKIIEKKEKMIGSLLEYYFDPEEDGEYIHENKP
jgi:hypothetical protein